MVNLHLLDKVDFQQKAKHQIILEFATIDDDINIQHHHVMTKGIDTIFAIMNTSSNLMRDETHHWQCGFSRGTC